MTNIVVITFPNIDKALTGADLLRELEIKGEICVYEKVMIRKDQTGEIRQLQTNTTQGLRISSGIAFGALIGMLGGPVGILVGVLSGTLAGTALEADYMVFAKDISSKMNHQLKPGTVAILAEINENDLASVDNAVLWLDASLLRSDINYLYQDYEDRKVKLMDEYIVAERMRLRSVLADDMNMVRRKITELKEKRKQRIKELKGKHLDSIKEKLIAKIQKHKEAIFRLEGRWKRDNI